MTKQQIAIIMEFAKLPKDQKIEVLATLKDNIDKGTKPIIKDGQDHGLLLKPESQNTCPTCNGTGRV